MMNADIAKAIELYTNSGLTMDKILTQTGLKKTKFYRIIAFLDLPNRCSLKRKNVLPLEDMLRDRQFEKRNCTHYYGDDGCLDAAARKDLKAVPCRGCKRYEFLG